MDADAPATTGSRSADIDAAVAALPDAPARVFLAIGRQHIAPFARKPQHAYTLRFVDAPEAPLPLPDAEVIVSRGPFTLDGELRADALARHRMDRRAQFRRQTARAPRSMPRASSACPSS